MDTIERIAAPLMHDTMNPGLFGCSLGTPLFRTGSFLYIAQRVLFVAAAVSSVSAAAQIATPPYADNILTPTSPIGTPPGIATDGANESINLSNGALTVYVPLLSIPQRGGWSLPLAYIHSSNGYYLQQNVSVVPFDNNTDGQQNSWTTTFSYNVEMVHADAPFEINLPRLQASIEYAGSWDIVNAGVVVGEVERVCLTNFAFTDWEGSKHPFAITQSCNQPNLASQPFVPSTVADSTDGSSYRIDLSNVADVKVISKSGTTYHFYGMHQPFPDGPNDQGTSNYENWYDARAGLMTDVNGNSVSIQTTSTGYTVTDTLGRSFVIGNAGISYTDSNNASRTISFSLQGTGSETNVFPALTCSYSPRSNGSGPNPPGTCTANPAPGSSSYVATVTYPPSDSNGTARTISFTLDHRLRITEINYPAGGYTRYDYTDSSIQSWSTTTITHYTMQEVSHKYECPASTGSCSQEYVTTYSPTISIATSGSLQPYNSSVKVTDPLGNYTVHNFSSTTAFQVAPKEVSVYKYDSSNKLYWSQQTQYMTMGTTPVATDLFFPRTITTTLNDGTSPISSTSTYNYDTYATQITGGPQLNVSNPITMYIDNPIEVDEADFDGSTKKKTTTSWEPLGYFTGGGGHILDRPALQTVTDMVTSNQNTTTYVYDSGANTAGNMTQKTVTATGAPNAVTQYAVNSYGEVTQITDADGHSTVIGYTDAWADTSCAPPASSAYATSITNAAGEVRNFTYNSCFGTIASVTLTNSAKTSSLTTSYGYDELQRVVSVNFPDGGGKKACYFDSAPNTITTYTLQDSGSSLPQCSTPTSVVSGTVTDSVTLDGVGRKLRTQVLSDPAGVTVTDTTYDALGRVQSASNPYRSTTDSTYGITSFLYDPLGRRTYQCQPDNSSSPSTTCSPLNSYQQWSYSNNAVTFADERRNQWIRTSDALGHLISVLEPSGGSGSPSMETDYTYDGFGNLASVTQHGGSGGSAVARVRTFSYTGISQLLTSSNPESGTVCYGTWSGSSCSSGYDAVGNLKKKTDARGVVSTYTYDVVNRLLSKSYNDTATTPTACYQYDSMGRLINHWTQALSAGACSVTGPFLTKETVLAFDAMGRPTTTQQQTCIGSKCAAPAPYAVGFGYDLAGNVVSLTNSAGAQTGGLTLTSYFDGTSRPCLITSSQSGNLFAVNPAISGSSVGYAPFGGMMNWYLGSTSSSPSTSCASVPAGPLSVSQSFTNRLWIGGILASGQVPH